MLLKFPIQFAFLALLFTACGKSSDSQNKPDKLSKLVSYAGEYWGGYNSKTLDFEKMQGEGRWDFRNAETGTLTTKVASTNLNNGNLQTVENILGQFVALEVNRDACGEVADGDEIFLSLTYENQPNPVTYTRLGSLQEVCADHYVSDEIYQELVEALDIILPEPS